MPMTISRALRLASVCSLALAATFTAPTAQAALLRVSALDGVLIPGQYIVKLGKPLDSVTQSLPVAAIAAALLPGIGGGRVLHVYEHALRGFAVQLSPAQALLLSLNPLVESVEPDRVMSAVVTQNSATWGLDRSDQRGRATDGRYVYPDTGAKGVHVYVLDTGINANHSEFTGRIGNGRNVVSDKAATDAGDCHGHGTHVSSTAAGTLYGVAKKATVHAVRVLGCNGSGSTSTVIAGVDWVTANVVKPAVVNLSVAGGASSTLDGAVRKAIAASIPVVTAAGNDNADACGGSPARVAEAITVGATTSGDAKASYSNFGTCLDLWAPGTGITGALYSSNTGSKALSGTSMASPHVAGAVALVLARGGSPTPAKVRDTLVAESTANALTGSLGSGSPNRLLFVQSPASAAASADNAPVASFSATCTGLNCSFNGADSADDKGIASYAWAFGDSSGGNGVSVSRQYAAGRTYIVTLTVTDTVGQSHSQTRTVTANAQGSSSTSPCSDCTTVNGTLSAGGTAYQPSSTGFASNGGSFKGYLRGPSSNADFDLYLEKLGGTGSAATWTIVSRKENTTSSEDFAYSGAAGTYRWRIASYSGTGSYTFYFKNP